MLVLSGPPKAQLFLDGARCGVIIDKAIEQEVVLKMMVIAHCRGREGDRGGGRKGDRRGGRKGGGEREGERGRGREGGGETEGEGGGREGEEGVWDCDRVSCGTGSASPLVCVALPPVTTTSACRGCNNGLGWWQVRPLAGQAAGC